MKHTLNRVGPPLLALGLMANCSSSTGPGDSSGSDAGNHEAARGGDRAGPGSHEDAASHDAGMDAASSSANASDSGSDVGSTADAPPTSPTGDTLPGEFDKEFAAVTAGIANPLLTPLAKQSRKTVYPSGSATVVNDWNAELKGCTNGCTGGGTFGKNDHVGGTTGRGPVYVSSSTDQLVKIRCTDFGGGCVAAQHQVHLKPTYFIEGTDNGTSYSDNHIIVIDTSLNEEIDCWNAKNQSGSQGSGGNTSPQPPDLTNNTLTCGWAGYYPLGTSGINGTWANANDPSNGTGVAFGPAVGLVFVTPNELLRGQINHAIALNASCANGAGIYPSDRSNTDGVCTTSDPTTGGPHYGTIFQLIWTPDKIATKSNRLGHQFSKECQAMLTALATYGAYIGDTGNYGSVPMMQDELPYIHDASEMGTDDYPQVISDLKAAGDADSSGNWTYCMGNLGPQDFQVVELEAP